MTPGVARLGTAAQSPSDQTSLAAHDAQQLVDLDAAAVVDRQAERAQRAGWRPRRPSRRRSRSRSGGRRRARRPRRRPTPARCRADLDAAPAQRALGEARQAVGRLAQDALAPSTSTQRGLTWARRGWLAQRVLGHLRDLGDRLDAGEAGAGDDEGQPPRAARVGRGVGELDLAQDVVAQADRVAEVLQAEGVLAQARDGRRAGHRSERDDELLVGDRDAAGLGLHLDDAPLGIERDGAAEHAGRRAGHMVRSGTTTWRGSMLPGGRLGQQRRVEHEVGRVDDRRAAAAELAGDVGAGEAAAEHEHAAARRRVRGGVRRPSPWELDSRVEYMAAKLRSARPGSNRVTP